MRSERILSRFRTSLGNRVAPAGSVATPPTLSMPDQARAAAPITRFGRFAIEAADPCISRRRAKTGRAPYPGRYRGTGFRGYSLPDRQLANGARPPYSARGWTSESERRRAESCSGCAPGNNKFKAQCRSRRDAGLGRYSLDGAWVPRFLFLCAARGTRFLRARPGDRRASTPPGFG
ncbi:hypothetical protein BC834DRAFT_353036 [Gloeopeniophorella convolvens]|nr:hypothetical protein BC834DRAFT_353036 [Gloeopeniophorella convolvens]